MKANEGPYAAFLRELSIASFRGIEHFHRRFETPQGNPSKLIVFAGPNGCGKTAVLEACLLAAGARELVKGNRGTKAIKSGADDYEIKAEFVNYGNQILSVTRHSRPELLPDAKEFDGTINCLYFSSNRSPGKLFTQAEAERFSKGSWEGRRLNSIRDNLKKAKLFELSHVENQEKAAPTSNDKPFSEIVKKLDNAWNLFYPDSGERFVVEAIGTSFKQDFDVFLKRRTEGRIPLHYFSSGQREVFTFLGWMLTSGFEKGIIAIDEPELHLDPQWHRVLMRALQILKPDSQFIIATHSPEIFSAAKSYERFFLAPFGDPRPSDWVAAPVRGAE